MPGRRKTARRVRLVVEETTKAGINQSTQTLDLDLHPGRTFWEAELRFSHGNALSLVYNAKTAVLTTYFVCRRTAIDSDDLKLGKRMRVLNEFKTASRAYTLKGARYYPVSSD